MILTLAAWPLLGQSGLTPERHARLHRMLAESPVFQRGFAGFSLYDPAEQHFWYNYRADHYFTPASNAKVLTFFAVSNTLRDSLPLLFYQDLGDTLQCWGAGNPLLLHPDFGEVDSLFRWLLDRDESVILYSADNWRDQRFGSGWSWDDFPYGYQMEKSALPIYGNAVRFQKTRRLDTLLLLPDYFRNSLVYIPDQQGPAINRKEDQNIFTFNRYALVTSRINRTLPFRYSPQLAVRLLSEALDKTVQLNFAPLPPPRERRLLQQPLPDTLLRRLLWNSDNFVAEQLLLSGSAVRYGHLDSDQLLDYVRDTLLRGLPHPIEWVDGSGLSRYNQFSPRSLVLVLAQLYAQYEPERLLGFFPAGGSRGTIANYYPGRRNQPYVFAKTGSLRHIHCISGYLKTRGGRTLIFSFMINNFLGSSRDLKLELQDVFEWIRDNG